MTTMASICNSVLSLQEFRPISYNNTTMIRGIKLRLYPNKEQKEFLSMQFGHNRFVYNEALNYRNEVYKKTKASLSCFDMQKRLVNLKEQNQFLKKGENYSYKCTLRNLDRAFSSFFNGTSRFPKFKSKYNVKQSYSTENCKMDNNFLTVPKLSTPIKCIVTKRVTGNIKLYTISKDNLDYYYVSICYDDLQECPAPKVPLKDKAIGIDLGLKDFATMSNGEKIDNPKFYHKKEKHIKRAQKSFSRKKKDSKNRFKAKHKLALLCKKHTNQNHDFLHKATYSLIHKNQGIDTICVENLNITGMKKNRHLSKSIQHIGWGEFLRQLQYKCDWSGKTLLKCDRFDPTSKTCNDCGWKLDNLRLSERTWTCLNCGIVHDRDTNAAKNIIDFSFLKKYPEGTGNSKPVERKALAFGLVKTKLISEKQEAANSELLPK